MITASCNIFCKLYYSHLSSTSRIDHVFLNEPVYRPYYPRLSLLHLCRTAILHISIVIRKEHFSLFSDRKPRKKKVKKLHHDDSSSSGSEYDYSYLDSPEAVKKKIEPGLTFSWSASETEVNWIKSIRYLERHILPVNYISTSQWTEV